MSAKLACPECSTPVPATGITSQTGIGTGGGEIDFQPARQSADCPGCGVRLRRNVEGSVTDWKLQMTAEDAAAAKLDEETQVGARIAGLTGPPRDGDAWSVIVTDGNRFERIEVEVSGTQAAMAGGVERRGVEQAVEQRAAGMSREQDRLTQLVAAAPIILAADEIRG